MVMYVFLSCGPQYPSYLLIIIDNEHLVDIISNNFITFILQITSKFSFFEAHNFTSEKEIKEDFVKKYIGDFIFF